MLLWFVELSSQLCLQLWWYSVVVSINGCDPFDPGSNPGTAIIIFFVIFGFLFCLLTFSVSCERANECASVRMWECV